MYICPPPEAGTTTAATTAGTQTTDENVPPFSVGQFIDTQV